MEAHRPTDLRRALAAISRTQRAWLAQAADVAAGRRDIADALPAWQERLHLLKLHLIRAEHRLLHYLAAPPAQRPRPRESSPAQDLGPAYRHWDAILPARLHAAGIETSYQRLTSVIDIDSEPVTADIATDLVMIAAVAETTAPRLAETDVITESLLEDLAFHHVLAPWKTRGLPALQQILRWLDDYLAETSWL